MVFIAPFAERYQRGRLSPEGYYQDSFDYTALRDALLLPLGPGGAAIFRRYVFDYRADRPVLAPVEVAEAILCWSWMGCSCSAPS